MTGNHDLHLLADRALALACELGLMTELEDLDVHPLTGGVASDVAVVVSQTRTFVVKFALPKLKVAADWRAPIHRNKAEYAWLNFARQTCPDNAIALFGHSERMGGFAMEYLDGDDVQLWKTSLLHEVAPTGESAKVGALLGRLHQASSRAGFDRSPFENHDDFRSLRLEPYLDFTASHHSDLADELRGLSEALYLANGVLVHGDVSPKNIFFRGGAPLLLDAECATMGDASFDPAFCLTHLFLKAIHIERHRNTLFDEASAFWNAYADFVVWEPRNDLEARITALVPALMLARIDGKSPVEYLDVSERETVRRAARRLIKAHPPTLRALINELQSGVTT